MPTIRANCLTQVLSGNKAIIQVFGGFDWPSSVSASKIMAKANKTNLGKKQDF